MSERPRPRIPELSSHAFDALLRNTITDQAMFGHHQYSDFDPMRLATAHVRAMATDRVLERLDNKKQKEAIIEAGDNARAEARTRSAWNTNFKDMSA